MDRLLYDKLESFSGILQLVIDENFKFRSGASIYKFVNDTYDYCKRLYLCRLRRFKFPLLSRRSEGLTMRAKVEDILERWSAEALRTMKRCDSQPSIICKEGKDRVELLKMAFDKWHSVTTLRRKHLTCSTTKSRSSKAFYSRYYNTMRSPCMRNINTLSHSGRNSLPSREVTLAAVTYRRNFCPILVLLKQSLHDVSPSITW
jgi:hypothetical protein